MIHFNAAVMHKGDPAYISACPTAKWIYDCSRLRQCIVKAALTRVTAPMTEAQPLDAMCRQEVACRMIEIRLPCNICTGRYTPCLDSTCKISMRKYIELV